MKKVLAVIAVVIVVCVAGAAFAQTRGRDDARRMPPQLQKEFTGEQGHLDQRRPEQQRPGQQNFGRPEDFDGAGCRFGRMGRMGRGRGLRNERLIFAPDMPEEIRDKLIKAEKLRIDLRVAFNKEPLDKDELLEIFGKIQKAENEAAAWRFGKRIDQIEAFRKQRELNSNVPPAPKPEAPAPKGEAPEAPAPEE